MKKVAKILSHIVLTLAFVGYIAYQFRTDPVGFLSGKEVTGIEAPFPDDWTFTSDFETVAVETRPGNPHSVTTLTFVFDGSLWIPASDGSKKDWPKYVLQNSNTRIKVGDVVYPVQMTREMLSEPDIAAVREIIVEKYPRFADAVSSGVSDVWFFRVSPR